MEDGDGIEGLSADVYEMLAYEKDPELKGAVELAIADGRVLEEILKGVLSKEDAYRYNCFKVLFQISERKPAILYPKWDYFVELFSSDNAYHRSISVRLIANLTSVDTEERFDAIFERYFDLLDDESVMVARYLAQSAGRVGKWKPYLRARITERLLRIDETHHTEGRRDLIKADIIQSLEEYFEKSDEKEAILAFVEGQLGCSSPKTRKMARGFLQRLAG